MKKLTLTTSAAGQIIGVFVDAVPAGSPAEFLAQHPQLVDSYLEAAAAHHRQLFEAECSKLRARLSAMEAVVTSLRAKYEPAPAPANLIVLSLPAPIGEADHAGITGYAKGHWHADLLRRTGPNEYALVVEDGLQFPGGTKVTSLSELKPSQVAADLAAYAATK